MTDLRDFLMLSYGELEDRNLEAKKQRSDRVPLPALQEKRLKYLTDERRIKAVTVLFSDLEGRLHMLDYDKKFLLRSADNLTFDGSSIRVPTPNVSVIDFKFVAKRKTSPDEINNAIKTTADGNGPLKGILGYTDEPNVSSDFNHDDRSSIFHLDQTKVIDGNFVRVLSWYDNEWGFSNRMADTAVAMAKLI